MGNSEVGHLNIGAGRIVHMDITRIDLLIATSNCKACRSSNKLWSVAASVDCI